MKPVFTLNRDLPTDKNAWIHLVPKGEFRGVVEKAGKRLEIVQVIDDDALASVMADYRALSANRDWTGYLVDREHFSHDAARDSEAAAWIKTLEARPDGIWGLPEWTDLGENLVANRRYKHLSPVFGLQNLSGNRYRVVALNDIGLTNKPMLKTMVPITNRDRNTEEAQMEEILRTLLSMPDANAEQLAERVKQAIELAAEAKALKARAEAAETERDEMKSAALNRDADAFVEKHKARITDAEKVKALFIKNREAAEEFVALLKEPPAADAKPVKVLNRADGKSPEHSPAAGDEAAAESRRIERDELVETLQSKNRQTFSEAWHVAKLKRPDLFVD
jgi:phage I-like protein